MKKLQKKKDLLSRRCKSVGRLLGKNSTRHVDGLDDKVRVLLVGNTSVRIVPGNNRSNESKVAANLAANGRVAKMRNGEEKEGNVKEQEKTEECNGRLESQHEHDKGEEKPAEQKETNNIVKVCGIVVSLSDTKGLGLESSPSEPESTVRRKSSGTKGVLNDNLPHTSQELNETTVEVCKTNDTRGVGDTSSMNVNQGKNKSSQGKSAKTKGRRVGKFSRRSLRQTRVQGTTESSNKLMLVNLGVTDMENLVVVARGGDTGNSVTVAVVGVGGARMLISSLLLEINVVDV